METFDPPLVEKQNKKKALNAYHCGVIDPVDYENNKI